jgi:methyl-accepting chemotaxis protein
LLLRLVTTQFYTLVYLEFDMETQFATAVSSGDDPRLVAEQSATTAVENVDADRVDFCQVFCSSLFDHEAAIDGVRSVIGDSAALIGCSSTGEFSESGSVDQGIAVALVTSDTIQFHTGLGTELHDSVPLAVQDALDEIPQPSDGYPYRSAVNIHDGLQGVSERLAVVLHRKLGPRVQIVGGAASDNYELESTPVFCGDRIAEDAIAIATFDTQDRSVVAMDHGHEPISDLLEVTAVDDNIVRELNGEPAFDVWCAAVQEKVQTKFDTDIYELDPDGTELFKLLGFFEFGINQGDSYKIRWPRIHDSDAGSLQFTVGIPEGTVFRVMESTVDSQIESARATAVAADELADQEYAGGFIYDCACREIVLQEEFETAVAAMSDELGAPFIGFETYGEMYMEMGQTSGAHNTSTVIQLLPK